MASLLPRAFACAAFLSSTLLAPAAAIADVVDHGSHPAPVAPAAGDARFLPGTVGPVVFRGTAATVTIPDGPGFGGETGRRQNAGDLRKNNYSVTDANYNNVLGLLPAHPDTGAPLTYVQHIQLYAAAGYVEAYAPDVYAHMILHQNRGEGTVLGAAGYLLGLVRTPDPAAHGLSTAQIPATLPGTTMTARAYVRATRDATNQQWARPHHAQTAPGVLKMLVAAGVNPSAALVLTSDDGISGAGRLNGMNEQDGSRDGFNNGERATWAFAAQLQAQTGIGVVQHLMHGHDHAGIDASALTKPKINALLGLAADDRSASNERAAAIAAGLGDGRIATPATAAADQNLVVRNTMYLQPRTSLDVDVDLNASTTVLAGTERIATVKVSNGGPHIAQDVSLTLTPSLGQTIVRVDGPAGVTCSSTTSCALGDISAETSKQRVLRVTVRAVTNGSASLRASVTTSSPARGDLDEARSVTIHANSHARVGFAVRRFGIATRACGATLARPCIGRSRAPVLLVATVTPGREHATASRRSARVVVQRKVGRAWKHAYASDVRLDRTGRMRVSVPARIATRGALRIRIIAERSGTVAAAASPWRYTVLR